MKENLFNNPADMEPLIPEYGRDELIELVCEIFRLSGKLSAALHPITRSSIAELIRTMNSYYSNLIEGHRTNPHDIEKALHNEFSDNPEQRDLQKESVAHIKAQKALEERLKSEDGTDLFSGDWICWIHREFYKHLPERFRRITDDNDSTFQVIPGQLRQENVSVGRHIAPDWKTIPSFLKRFSQYYNSDARESHRQLLAIAASHHRLAWIHPFLDGNGRVVRLFSHALLIRSRTDADGLWAISRGLARHDSKYKEMLANADQARRNDYDGRGNLSDRALYDFCKFFLITAIDQIDFMSSILEVDQLENRIDKYLQFASGLDSHILPAKALLLEALRQGEFARGEAGRITNRGERSARNILKTLTEAKLLISDTAKGPVRLGFPEKVLEYYFPLLYPAGTDLPTADLTGQDTLSPSEKW